MKDPVNIFWFRRDLRLDDNSGLYHALRSGQALLPVFIFDRNILDELEEKQDRRVEFIHGSLEKIQEKLEGFESTLDSRYGFPLEIFKDLVNEYRIETVFTNHDYEPYARERDKQIAGFLNEKGISFKTFKDQVILEKNEIVKVDGSPYTVFTPYSTKWGSVLAEDHLKSFATKAFYKNFYRRPKKELISLEAMNFKKTGLPFPSGKRNLEVIQQYDTQRDFPAINGSSKLSIHLRFGTISIRKLVLDAKEINQTYLKELIWRDFYQMILWHFPHVVGHAFKAEYDRIQWRNNEKEFEAWCNGMTGYPIVDAGMRELNKTGFMHNRLRMITASFLAKHLLIDWRWGEAYFAKKLLDFDLAANNGGWQWAAGSGCDAAPYFRIFNPYLQTKKFDPELKYIKQWVPEFEDFNYPAPVVDHVFARKRCLEAYSTALRK